MIFALQLNVKSKTIKDNNEDGRDTAPTRIMIYEYINTVTIIEKIYMQHPNCIWLLMSVALSADGRKLYSFNSYFLLGCI